MARLKKEIFTVLKRLNDHGYEAFLVGGAVRNYLLNKPIEDYDITTNADPNAVKMLFSDYIVYDIGRKLGTVAIIINKTVFEITPYRTEADYSDHRHPDSITFSQNLLDDLKRRDFTINALCLDSNKQIIDYFNGVDDLNNRQIKAIGKPVNRFNEDALRILRAIRFKAQLNFDIEEKTNKQLFKSKDLLNYISAERKKDELLQILECKSGFEITNEYNEIFQTFIPLKITDRKTNNFSSALYALAFLLEEKVNLKQLKYSSDEIELIRLLQKAKTIDIKDDFQFICLVSNRYQKQILQFLQEYHRINLEDRYNKLSRYMIELNDLHITGQEISSYGYSGKKIGEIKNLLLEMVHKQQISNNNRSIHKFLRENIL